MATEVAADSLGDEWKVSTVTFSKCKLEVWDEL